MNTPEWFGSIGVMNSSHMHRRGVRASLRLAMGELRAAAAGLRLARGAATALERRDRVPLRARQVLPEAGAGSF